MQEQSANIESTEPAPQVELDPIKVQEFRAQLERQQNLLLGVLAGSGAAIAGAMVWVSAGSRPRNSRRWSNRRPEIGPVERATQIQNSTQMTKRILLERNQCSVLNRRGSPWEACRQGG